MITLYCYKEKPYNYICKALNPQNGKFEFVNYKNELSSLVDYTNIDSLKYLENDLKNLIAKYHQITIYLFP